LVLPIFPHCGFLGGNGATLFINALIIHFSSRLTSLIWGIGALQSPRPMAFNKSPEKIKIKILGSECQTSGTYATRAKQATK
jgi:hypothetical protein